METGIIHSTVGFSLTVVVVALEKSNLPDVPDLAIVPRFLMRSSLVIPMPVSRIVKIFFSLSSLICQLETQPEILSYIQDNILAFQRKTSNPIAG
jgi:hypothetical protein